MKILSSAAALAAAITFPTVAHAQATPILVVDTEQVMGTCTACVAAQNTLRSRQTTAQTRIQTLQRQLQTEAAPIETAVEALKGKEPDAALRARVAAFQTKQRAAQQELETSQNTLQSTAAHVQQQLGTRLVQIVEQVRARRNASIVVSKQSTLANSNTIDVTTEVLTALNTALPAVSVTPLPQSAQPARTAPSGR